MISSWLQLQLRVGTKRAIEEHNAELLRALEMVVEHPGVPQGLKLAFFKVRILDCFFAVFGEILSDGCARALWDVQESRHSYGRTALLLSGGATMVRTTSCCLGCASTELSVCRDCTTWA